MVGAKPRSSSMMLGLDLSGWLVWGIWRGAGVLTGVYLGTMGWGTRGLIGLGGGALVWLPG